MEHINITKNAVLFNEGVMIYGDEKWPMDTIAAKYIAFTSFKNLYTDRSAWSEGLKMKMGTNMLITWQIKIDGEELEWEIFVK